MTDDKGYLFPIPVDPGSVLCFRVYIPNDPLYMAAFWSSYQFLSQWSAWKRDEDHNAKDVAAVWMPLYQQARTEFLAGEGCEVFDVRQNPDNSCRLDKSDDGGETWTEWANLQKCPPLVMQSPDGRLWWWNPVGGSEETGAWEPVPTDGLPDTAEPPIDPPYPPGSTEYEDDTARCIAAANITYQLYEGTRQLCYDWAVVSVSVTALMIGLAAALFFPVIGVLIAIATVIFGLSDGITQEEAEAAWTSIDWESVRDNLACFMQRDGTLTESGKTSFLAWMEAQYTSEFNIAWASAKLIVQNVSAAGLTSEGTIAQSVIEADCDPTACLEVWEHDSTSDTDLADWFAAAQPYNSSILGTYSGGSWNSEYADAGNDLVNIKSPDFVPSNVRLTGILIEAQVAIGSPYHLLQFSESEDWSVSGTAWTDLAADVWETREATFSEIDVRSLNVFLRQQQHSPAAKIRRVKLTGVYV